MVPRRSLMVGCCPWVAIDPDTEGLSAQMKSSERRRVSLRRFGRSSFLPEARPPATMAAGGEGGVSCRARLARLQRHGLGCFPERLPGGSFTLGLSSKCLARSNKSGGRAETTKPRHDDEERQAASAGAARAIPWEIGPRGGDFGRCGRWLEVLRFPSVSAGDG